MQMVWDPLEAASWANLEANDPGNRLTPTMTRVPTLVQAGAGGERWEEHPTMQATFCTVPLAHTPNERGLLPHPYKMRLCPS